MKRIIVETAPMPPKPERKVVTQLTGKELVGYVTESGTICILQRLTKSKDHNDQERYGFCNLAYSSSGPCFVANSWLEAIKVAGAARELYAFEEYKELILWIREKSRFYGKLGEGMEPLKSMTMDYSGAKLEKVTSFVTKVDTLTEDLVKLGEANKAWLKAKEALDEAKRDFYESKRRRLEPINPDDIDSNGSGQVNHTHKNMTILFEKINELVKCHNNLNEHVKGQYLGAAYGGSPVKWHTSHYGVDLSNAVPPPLTIKMLRMKRDNLRDALQLAILKQGNEEARAKYTGPSAYLAGLREILKKLTDDITLITLD